MSIRQRLVAWIAPPEQRSLTSWDLLKAHVSGWGVAPDSGEVVTHLSAEHSVATVFSCVQGIASAIGSLPAMGGAGRAIAAWRRPRTRYSASSTEGRTSSRAGLTGSNGQWRACSCAEMRSPKSESMPLAVSPS
jgi:hypothetical protein